MKLLHFADLHLDTPFAWARPELARKRRRALRDTLAAMVDLALDEGVDALCCGGDLYEHDHVAADTGTFLAEQFSRLGAVPVLLAPGNHDRCDATSVYRHTAWPQNVVVFAEPQLRPHRLTDGLAVWGAGHTVPANTPNLFRTARATGEGVHIGLLHASLRSGMRFQEEGKEPHAAFDEGDIAECGLHHALLGHFHKPRDEARFTYPGNPEPLAFGESGPGDAVLVHVASDGSVRQDRRRVARTEYHDVSLTVDDCGSEHELRDRATALLAEVQGVVRLVVSGEVAPQLDVTRQTFEGVGEHLDGLVVRLGRLTTGYDLDAIAAQESTVQGRFVRDVRDDPHLDEDQKRRIIVTGLRAFEGRTDLAVR